jgi:hypothetical protein
MRRADALWKWDGAALADVTQSLGDGSAPATLAQGDALYVGHQDWISGLYLQVDLAPDGNPQMRVETYDGATGEWKRLPLQERVDQIGQGGHALVPAGFSFKRPGVAYWGTSQWLWTLKVAGAEFPEYGAEPPSTPTLYWVRLVNGGPTSLTIARALPSLYNTYASHQEVAQFMGLPEFTEVNDPLQSFVRKRIRANEDWLDVYTRRAWRMRTVYNERATLNPYGMLLRMHPVWFVSRVSVWTGGTTATELFEGRQRDFYLSDNSMIYFTRIALGRGLPWASISSRYLRLPGSVEMDYVYGEDFDVSEKREQVADIVVKRTAADIVLMQDWTAVLVNNPDAVPKPDKARQYIEQSIERADELRMPLIA